MRIPLLSNQTFCGSGIPDDWQNWKIQKFRDIRHITGSNQFDRFIGVPVTGDSMNKVGIFHGDVLITKLTKRYVEDKIGVWQTPHGRTAKYAHIDFDGAIVLHNKNGWKQEWQIDEIELVGIVVRVERDYE